MATFAELIKAMAEKNQPGAAAVHQDTSLGAKRPKKKPVEGNVTYKFRSDILKTDLDQQLVYGWASVIEKDGKIVTDLQDDQIAEKAVIKAAHEFMLYHRAGGDSHQTIGVGQVVESMVFTKDLQKALNINLGRVGWLIGMKVHDDAVWQRVKSGDLKAFSIGGKAHRRLLP